MRHKTGRDGYAAPLGPLEQGIMELLWAEGRLTGKEIHARVAATRKAALTTVLTVLERLVKKGLVEKTRGESVYLYLPAFTRDEFARSVSQGVFRGILGISSSALAASFVDALAETDPEELKRLSELVDIKRRELGLKG